jgi:hypothetical protein
MVQLATSTPPVVRHRQPCRCSSTARADAIYIDRTHEAVSRAEEVVMTIVEQASQWLRERELPGDCPSCGTVLWNLEPCLLEAPLIGDDARQLDNGNWGLVMVALICPTCARVLFYSVGMMGIPEPS